MAVRSASVALTCALAFFMVGRFLGSWIMRRIKATTVYPPSAKMKETTGITYVTILVNASGTVDSAYVAQGSGSSVLDAAAIDAAYQWTFSPALDKYGVPVPCRITFPVEFRLN